jgi:hypothetical protein
VYVTVRYAGREVPSRPAYRTVTYIERHIPDVVLIQLTLLMMSTFSILSEFYLQHLENSSIYDILLNSNIIGYFRYVDDLLIVYNENKTDIEDLLHRFNNIAPKLNFTMEKETKGDINFLDITIHRGKDNFSIDIFRKPTYTDVIIPSDSCHPLNTNMQQYASYITC